MCVALLLAIIPLNKLSNTSFRQFLGTYTGKYILTQATLTHGYINEIFDGTINTIKLDLLGKEI